ncbi:MAG TPA: neutral zinc metallopeptidase [Agromyces sp.]|nr:neutral zinc metallopeptidase [Agromyces sp.]
MKLRRRRSSYVEDRRGQATGGGGLSFPGLGGGGGLGRGGGLGGGGLPIGKGGGIGLIVVVIVLAVCIAPRLTGDGGGELGDILGGDPFSGFGAAQPGDTTTPLDPDDRLFGFVNAVVDDVNATWVDIFAESNQRYEQATLVVFDRATPTECGTGSAATGPFYCPADGQVYLDLSFFRELRDRFGAPGDFAQAYVIAHEYGHHVQNLLGINAEVQRIAQQEPDRANDMSVRLELQADCLAGVWGHTALQQGELSEGDLEEALAAAESIGDDRIQEATTGRIDRESWTHGSSDQRATWFRVGFDSGDPARCDTFQADPL